ncbi:probable ubiquitin-like-specific protease 2A [Momordica charantia]|uniref:Probable ubiquitin-like-specific protease 2A n=1 Tax=Momordica charantia TaxID=3673 RepID=A0A6J1C7K2_MOMCH|nr:probable ubiquitin-like-specific protease 2A [Momordica charantia]
MGKRKLQPKIICIDLDLQTTEACGIPVKKCRSSLISRRTYRNGLKDSENVEPFQQVPLYVVGDSAIPRRKRSQSTRKSGCNSAVPSRKKKLDSRAFEYCFQNLWRSSPEEKKIQFTYLDCLWFSLYLKAAHRRKVLKWIKDKEIFSKKYVFVPIVCWGHWSLLIFCHFDESPESETRGPCMLLLDSLQEANPRRLEPDIRKFVLDIFKEYGRCKNLNFLCKIPLMVPKVPQQKNGEECGKFVLYFIHLFMEAAPQNFSIKDYPYFMKETWFTPEGAGQFYQKLDHLEDDISL